VRQSIGEAIRRLRCCRGLEQWQLAYAVGVSPSMMSRYERGRLRIPPDAMANIIRYLKAPGLGECYCWECPVGLAMREIRIRRAA